MFLARFCFIILAFLGFATGAFAEPQPDKRPELRVETRMHTGAIRRIGVDAACKHILTGSDDKTVRLWGIPENKRDTLQLLRVFRVPIGEGNGGKIDAVAISPDGKLVAAGGWDASYEKSKYNSIYIFDSASGRLLKRIGTLYNIVLDLEFSRDGKKLAAGLYGGEGVRIWDTTNWHLIAQDKDFSQKGINSVTFDETGRLFTASDDGTLRRYGTDGKLEIKATAEGGREPFRVALHPDGRKMAVGYYDTPAVEVYDRELLERLYQVDTSNVNNGTLSQVTWSPDGSRLYAGGRYRNTRWPVIIWQNEGKGARKEVNLFDSTVLDMTPCGDGLAIASHDPAFGLISVDGSKRLWEVPVTGDMRGKLRESFPASASGEKVLFGLGYRLDTPILFDLKQFKLIEQPEKDQTRELFEPQTVGIPVTDWEHNTKPKLNGKPIALQDYETTRALAIAPDRSVFALGSDYQLRLFKADGTLVWKRAIPGNCWGVNITRNGKLLIAAYGDGTIRWHRVSDGKELLALFVHSKDFRYIAWTPQGYYAASPGAEELIGWHLNRTWTEAAEFFPASRFRDQFNRPDIVMRVLKDLDEDAAIEGANANIQRKREDEDITKRLPPVITIVSPGNGATFSSRQLKVQYAVRSPSGLPIRNVRALIDGRPIQTGVQTKGFEAVKEDDANLSLTIEAPEHDFELTLVAEAEGSAPSEPSRVRLVWEGQKPVTTIKPKLYALLIGISNYKDPQITKLRWAAKDAMDMKAALERQKGLLYRDVEIRLLTDEEATAARVIDELAWIESAASQGDRVVVFLSGHGVTDSINDYFFVPHDARMEKRGVFLLPTRSTSVSRAQIVASLKRTQGHALFFFDTCHAAGASAGGATRGIDSTYQPFIDEMREATNGVLVLASSEGRQLSQEDDESKNGVFTRALVEGLTGKAPNRNGIITFDELSLYVAERVKELTRNTQNPVRDVITPSRNLAVAAVK